MLFRKPIERELLKLKLQAGKPLTTLQFYARELTDWETSPARRNMLDGDRYYMGDHDILHRKRTIIGPDGKLVEIDNLPNNRIVDNQYAKHVDQKTNYLLGKPITFSSDNTAYAQAVSGVLGKKFMRSLRGAGTDSYNCGISWLYPYYNDSGELTFKCFPGYEVLPFWFDTAHTELDIALRLYLVEIYYGAERKVVKKVDLFEPDGITTFFFESGVLLPDPDAPKRCYITSTDAKGKSQNYNWEKLPLIPIKCNAREIPLIMRGRALQDAINLLESNFVNGMEEDTRTTVLVLKNYDGQDLGEFRRNLMTYGAIKVRSVEGKDGGVESLQIEVNAENYKTVLDLLKKALVENLRSYDAKDDRMTGTPNQMNIQSMYSDMDLDANMMETELQAAFEDILWFVNTALNNSGQGSYEGTQVEVIFNRDMLINETEAIENCAKSTGIITDETIISQHPWVKDPTAELERLKAQKTEAEQNDPYRNAFEAAAQQQGGET